MKSMTAIARMTLTELLRDRFVALIGFVAFLLLALSGFLGSLTLDEQRRLLVHLGFSGFQITLVGLALFLGSWSLQRELDRQTCLLVLSRPISRTQFLLGKWMGAFHLLALFWVFLGLLHLALLGFDVDFPRYAFVHSTLLIEAAFILCLCLFFATFLKPLLALASTFTLWLAGHWREDMIFFANRADDSFFKSASRAAYWIFPPLDRLEIRTLHVLESGVPAHVGWPLLQLFFWSTLLLFSAQLVWRRRDLV